MADEILYEDYAPEYESFFMESNEAMGLMFNSYKPLLYNTNIFLDKLESAIEDVNKRGAEAEINLKGDITRYKNDVNIKPKPEEIDIRKIRQLKAKVQAFRGELEKTLERFAKLKNKIAYGGNLFRAILKRPVVYGKNMNSEKFESNTSNLRDVNRGMDWVEKSLLDIFNLVDQDLNILTLVGAVYAKNKIFESTEEQTEDVANSVIGMLPAARNEAAGDTWILNTYDKKKSSVPGYLGSNHDISKWGEEDDDEEDSKRKNKIPMEDDDDSADQYRRPSSRGKSSSVDDEDDEEETSKKSSSGQAINNYYYTYTNSLNRNTGSYNTTTRDDHSYGKHINSHNSSGNEKDDDEDDKSYKTISSANESSKPWELNIFNNDVFTEEVGDADDDRPTPDHPIQTALLDLDRNVQKGVSNVKKTANNVTNTVKAATKGVRRVKDWINTQIAKWKDADETEIREKIADPHTRQNLFYAIKVAIDNGAYLKAGVLFNPIILALHYLQHQWGGKKAEVRIRNEMLVELKNELKIIDAKIKDADAKNDKAAKYKLMRFQNELEKKMYRVAGKKMAEII